MLEITVPSPGESITEVTIDTWLKGDGEYVEKDEAIADIQSDKAMLTVYAEQAGVLSVKAAEGETVEVGSVIAAIDTNAAAPAGGGAKEEEAPKEEAKPAEAAAPVATPPQQNTYATGVPSASAEKAMHEKGLKPEDIQGTGRDGRITKADVINHKGGSNGAEKAAPAAPAAEPKPLQEGRTEERKSMSMLRRTLAKRLVSAKNDTAMLTTFNEVDMSGIMGLRKQYKERFKDVHGVGLGFMGLFSKACAMALMEFPAVNAYIDGDDLLFHNYADIGIAVSTERGLVVPVIRDVQSLAIHEIEMAIGEVAKKARENRITIQDMQGGTFTITNGGVFGSLLSTPILNPPQSAILGMHKIEERPIAVNGEVQVRPMMYVALSYDHRVIDGKESVSFLVRVKEYLEDPVRLLLGV